MRTALLALVLSVLFPFLTSCDTEVEKRIWEFDFTVSPQEVPATTVKGRKTWVFTVALQNNTDLDINLDVVVTTIYRTDTGYTKAYEYAGAEWPGGKIVLKPFSTYEYVDAIESDGSFNYGEVRRKYEARGIDGRGYRPEQVFWLLD